MHTTETPQQRLSRRVREQRLELGLSVRAASKLAGMDRNTWASLEDGTRVTQDRLYSGIERALEWPPGEIDRILDDARQADVDAANARIIAMTPHELAEHYIQIAEDGGPDAAIRADRYLEGALRIRLAAARQPTM